MKRLSLPSPAKLNLMLHVLGRRDDGYHNLQTLFQFLDYGDHLHFDLRQDEQICLSPNISGVTEENNLIVKAANKLKKATGCPLGVDIRLDKKLPMGGGLGGGSSNAATTFIALNHLWQTHITIDHLAELGLTLGADVPVFIKGQAAFAEGVGDRLHPVPQIKQPWYLVLIPDCHCDTAEVFSHKGLTRDSPAIKVSAAIEQQGRNDCQAVTRMIYPEVDKTLNLLNKFTFARMTGTGACVFSEHESESAAKEIFAMLPTDTKGFVAKGCNQSPLHRMLSGES